MLTESTVVIPTYNRPLHLTRILNYYNQHGKGLSIVVADSGAPENRKLDAAIIASFKDISIQHLNHYYSSIDPWHKILDAVQHVTTKYCLICADDDFVTPLGISECAKFLDANSDHVCAYGNNAWFSLAYDAECRLEFTYKYYESQPNTQPAAKERLLHKATDSSNVTYYSLHRTEFMKVLIGEAARITGSLRFAGAFRLTPDLFFAELLILWLPSIYGKMKSLDVLYYVREDCTPVDVSRVYITLPDLMNDKSYVSKQNEFISCVAGHLNRQSGIAYSEAQELAARAIMVYNRRTPPIVLAINSILNKIKLPGWLDLFVRRVYRVSFSLIYPPTGSGRILPAKYNSEMDKVRLSVLSSAEDVYGPCKK